jgi:polyisoprenyl-phosphate glycosyltransferase
MSDAEVKYVIVIPLYKDWESFEILVAKIKESLFGHWEYTKIVVVDDFSLLKLPNYLSSYGESITVLELTRNMGHQKAITIGLSFGVNTFKNALQFIVMDSDGEDMPEDIPLLQNAINEKGCGVCFAHRQKRNEKRSFRLFYKLYKYLFQMLTGKKISFGNFCILNAESAARIIHVSEIWLHFSSGVIKSKLNIGTIPTKRGFRYHGSSKMDYPNLINHGLSAIAVYSELVAIRITLIAIFMSFVSLISIGIIIGIKQFTTLAIPGWASFVTIGFLIIIAQFFSLGVLLSFVILSSKTVKNVNPALVYSEFIYKIHVF